MRRMPPVLLSGNEAGEAAQACRALDRQLRQQAARISPPRQQLNQLYCALRSAQHGCRLGSTSTLGPRFPIRGTLRPYGKSSPARDNSPGSRKG